MALKRWNLSTSSVDVELGVAHNDCDGEWVVQVTGTIGSGTITPKAYMKGQALAGRPGTDTTLTALAASDAVTVPYKTTASGTLTSGGTAMSTLGLYRVAAPAGASVILSYTAGGGSDLVVHARPSAN